VKAISDSKEVGRWYCIATLGRARSRGVCSWIGCLLRAGRWRRRPRPPVSASGRRGSGSTATARKARAALRIDRRRQSGCRHGHQLIVRSWSCRCASCASRARRSRRRSGCHSRPSGLFFPGKGSASCRASRRRSRPTVTSGRGRASSSTSTW